MTIRASGSRGVFLPITIMIWALLGAEASANQTTLVREVEVPGKGTAITLAGQKILVGGELVRVTVGFNETAPAVTVSEAAAANNCDATAGETPVLGIDYTPNSADANNVLVKVEVYKNGMAVSPFPQEHILDIPTAGVQMDLFALCVPTQL